MNEMDNMNKEIEEMEELIQKLKQLEYLLEGIEETMDDGHLFLDYIEGKHLVAKIPYEMLIYTILSYVSESKTSTTLLLKKLEEKGTGEEE